MTRFDGKVVAITGAAGGIGGATARYLSAQGASLVVSDTNPDRLAELVASLRGPVVSVVADVSKPEDVDAYVAAGVEAFGRIDHHHLNAGIPGPVRGLLGTSVEDFDRVIAVNLRGVFLGLRAAFLSYSKLGHRGNIVVTASIASQRGSADLFAYHASKHGVLGLVKNAAVYGGPLGIRVNAVAPGIVPTDLFGGDSSTGGGNDMAQRAMTTPLRRPGRADEIASVVAFLLGDESTYVTGQVVAANGGATEVNSVRPAGGAGVWDTTAVDKAIMDDFTAR